MPTVVESLVVTLGLDPADFVKGEKEVTAAFGKTKDSADRTAKDIEKSGRNGAEFIGKLRNEVIGLFAAFTAGRGLKEFVKDITRADAAVGRSAQTLDISTEALSAWTGVAERTGGSAAGITGSLDKISQGLQQFLLTGNSDAIPYFRALGISIVDANGKIKTSSELLLELADKFHTLDPARAKAIGTSLGIDPATISLLIRGRAAVQALLDEQKRLGVVTKEQSDAAAERQQVWTGFAQSLETLGRIIITELTPALDTLGIFLIRVSVWAQTHPKVLNAVFAGLSAVVGALTFIVIPGFLAALTGISAPVLAVVAAIGLIGAAGTAVIENWDEVRSWFEDFFAWIKPLFESFHDFGRRLGFSQEDEDYADKLGNGELQNEPTPAEREKSESDAALARLKQRLKQSSSNADTEAYIRQEAVKRGIDPDIAVRVAQSEGLGAYTGDGGSSFGPYQLHYGGIAKGGNAVSGLGDEFTRQTGLDARDPSTTRAQIDFALDQAAKGGWTPWHGWKGAQFAGVPTGGAQLAAAGAGARTSTSTSEVNIQNQTIMTQAADARGIARDIGPALRANSYAQNANAGAQ